jgi:hypothetical protein
VRVAVGIEFAAVYGHLDLGVPMRVYSDRFIFTVDLCFAAFAIVLLTATFLAAEVYATGDHMLADLEITNGSPSGDITVATAIPK